jgi:hypothetical protein
MSVVRLAIFGEHLAPTVVRVPEIRVDCLSNEYKLDSLVHNSAYWYIHVRVHTGALQVHTTLKVHTGAYRCMHLLVHTCA